MILDIDNRAYRRGNPGCLIRAQEHLPRTRNKKLTHLAGLSNEEYIVLVNANIAAFAACAREVGFPVFSRPLKVSADLLAQQEPLVFDLIDRSVGSVEQHAVDVAQAIRKRGDPEVEFAFINDRDQELRADWRGRQFVFDDADQPRLLSGELLRLGKLPVDKGGQNIYGRDDRGFVERYDLHQSVCFSVPVNITDKQVLDSRDYAAVLEEAYKSVRGYKAGSTVAETISLNFG